MSICLVSAVLWEAPPPNMCWRGGGAASEEATWSWMSRPQRVCQERDAERRASPRAECGPRRVTDLS